MKRAQFLSLIGATLAIGFSSILPARAQQQQQQQQPQPVQPAPSASENSPAAAAATPADRRAELIRKRAEWFQRQRAYPNEQIPAGAPQKAIEQRDRMIQQQRLGLHLAAPGIISFPGDGVWHQIGPEPTNIPSFPGLGNFGFPTASGRVTAMAADPSDPTGQTVYLGAAAGGVWKTTDGGAHWTPLTDNQPSLAIGSIAIDPNNHNTIYVGTGEENFNIDAFYGAGILKSTDGGATWSEVCTTVGASCPFVGGPLASPFGGTFVGAISVQPGGTGVLLAAMTSRIVGAGGVFRSTNGGATWTQVISGLAGTDVLFDPGTPANAFAAMGWITGDIPNGIYKSIDGGATWILQGGGLPASNTIGRVKLGFAPSTTGNTATVYAAIANAANNSSLLQSPGLFVTNNGGSTWTAVPNAPDFCVNPGGTSGQCFYDLAIAVHPTNPGFVVVGGSAYLDNSTTLFKATGTNTATPTWTTCSVNPCNNPNGTSTASTDFTIGSTSVRPHVDTHVNLFVPNGANPPRFYTGDDGGVWRTDDPTPSNPLWVDLNGTLAISQFYPGTMPSIGDENYGFGGTQDNDIQVFSGTLDWAQAPACGDGGNIAIDPTFPTTIYAGCNEFAGALVTRSVFYGQFTPGPTPTPVPSFQPAETAITASGDTMGFIPPLTIDKFGTLHFGTCQIWQGSVNFSSGAVTWTPAGLDLTNGSFLSPGTPCADQAYISTIDAAQDNTGNVFAGTSNGKVWLTSSFTEIDNGLLPTRHVTAVRSKRDDSTHVYATFSGFGTCLGCDGKGHVFKTTNATAGTATTWVDISGNLPDAPVNDMYVDHSGNPTFDALYIATDVGVFSCPDPEAATPCTNWTLVGDGLPNAPVLSLGMRRSSRILRAGTHGRSMFDIQLRDEQPGPLPSLSSLTPAAVFAMQSSAPATTVTVTGLNFGPNTQILVDGFVPTGVTTTLVSTTQITVSVPASLLTSGTVHHIGLSDPLGADTNTLPFTVMNPIPTVTNIVASPATGIVGEPVKFTVTGTGFVPGTELTFNGNIAAFSGTVSNNGTQVVFNVSGFALTAPSAGVPVNLLNRLPGGGGPALSTPFNFPVNANGTPEISFSFTPPAFGSFWPGTDAGTTSSTVINVQLTNIGGAPLTLNGSSATKTGTDPGDFALQAPTSGSPTCGFITGGSVTPIAVNGSCFFSMTFSPPASAPAGSRFATLTISDSDTGTDLDPSLFLFGTVNGAIPNFSVQRGTSSFISFCSVSGCFPTPVSFGSLPKGTSLEFDGILTDGGTGATPLNVTSITKFGPNASDFAIGAPSSAVSPPNMACNLVSAFPLASSGSCALGITFTATTTGIETATLEFTFSNPGVGKIDVPLSGSGVMPTISSLSPVIVATGGPAFTLNVTGSNFVLGSVVNVNDSARLTTFVSATQLSASIPTSDISTAVSIKITVTNPSGGGTSEPKTLIVSQALTGTNDNFADATNVVTTPTPFQITQDTTQFTANTAGLADPSPACAPGGASLSGKAKSAWFKFVAPASGKVVADTRYSSYNTILSVWTGTTGSFTAVACNNGGISGTTPESFVGFPVTNGTTYFLMVTDASASGAGGTLTFRLDFASAAPANDDWSNATVVTPPSTGTVYSNTVNTILATINTGGHNDPTPLCAPAGAANGGIANSVWYSFTPTSGTPVTADTLTSLDDTILSVWTGTPGAFTQIACNDNSGTGPTQVLQSQLSFTATANTAYYFMVTSVLGDGGTAFHLSLTSTQAGPAAKLAFTQQPTNTAVGAAITPSVQVSVEDAQGTLVTTATNSVTVAIGTNPSGGTLSGTATVSAVNGIATFPGLNINKLGTGYTLTASATSLTQATSTAFNITAGPPSKLAFTVQPSSVAAAASIAPSVQVSIEDAQGNVVTSATNSVTLAIGTNPGSGTLSGTATVNAVAGVATFPGMSINKAGTGYTLTANSGVLTGATSSSFNVTVGPATQLAFTVQPSNVAGAASITPSVQVSIEDAQGNVVTAATSAVTLAIGTNPSAGTLSGTATQNAVAGVATFPALSINKVGTGYTLKATSGALTLATSSAFNVTAGAATQLAFTVQPTNTAAGLAITPSVQVSVEDAGGNVVTGSSVGVTLAIGTNPSGGTLSGTATQNAVSGVATFPGLSINKVGAGYTLKATSGALTLATSTAFNITAGAASQLALTVQPTNTNAGAPITPPVQVSIEDAGGNVVTGSSAAVTLAIGTNPSGGTLAGTLTQNAVSGVATFPGLSINNSGTGYTLKATSGALTLATSTAFNVNVGGAAKLIITVQPTSVAAGASITPAVQVTIEDSQGNVVTSAINAVTMAIGANPGGGTLTGTATVNAVAGVATFSTLSINKVGTGYTLTANATGLTGATSGAFNVTAGAATQLAFTVQPSNVAAAASITPSVQVSIEDAQGNVVTTAISAVTLAIGTNPGSGTLSGTATQNAVAGVATFPGLSINKAGTGYTLKASSGVLTGATSSGFNVTAGTATQLAFTVQPSNVAAAASITPSVQVSIEDALGNVVTASTSAVTLAIGTNPSAGTLSGTATQNAVAGVATFPGLSINKAGTGYTLTASSGVLTGATSSAFNVTAGAATQLAFTVQPTNTVAGAAITPSIQVSIEDAGGNLVTTATNSVTVAIGTNPSSGTLAGTATLNAVAGVATFPGLSINKAGTGYTLKATSGTLTAATSNGFNVTAGAATQLAFTVQPSNVAAAASITPSVQVSVEDAQGNVVTAATSAVTLAIGTNPGTGTLSGTATVNAVAGVATFPGLSINKVGTGYTLKASSGVLTGATSSGFNVTAGTATQLAFTVQPSNVAAAASITPSVQVSIEDAQGNVVTASTSAVTLAIGTNPGGGALSGTATQNAVAGVATFPGMSLNKAGTGYTLTASSGVLTGATSSAFNVTAGAATQLAFTAQPSNVTIALSIAPSVQVSIEDAQGNVVTGATSAVTLAIGTNPGGGTLSGTATVNAVAGVATFSNLSINNAGTGYTLKASSGALTVATSSIFSVNATPPNNFTNTGGDSLWTNPANWSLGHVPTSSESATDTGGLNITLSVVPAQTVATMTFNNGGTLTISGAGSLTLTGASTASNVTINGGTLMANSTLTVSGTTTLTPLITSTLSGIGAASVVTTNGPLVWNGGTISVGTLNVNGGMTVNGAVTFSSGGSINNSGTATMNAGSTLSMNPLATLNNQATGKWNVQAGGISTTAGGTSVTPFLNAGTFNMAAGAGTFTFTAVAFSGTGTANLNSGTLILLGGGAYSGPINVANGATLSLGVNQGGSPNFSALSPSSVTGAGSVLFTGGPSTVAGAYNVTGTTTVGAAPADTNAVANFNSASATTANLNLNAGALGGTGNLSISGTTTWAGGTLSNAGTTTIAASTGILNLTGTNTPKQSGGTLLIAGTANFNAGLDIGGNAVITVPSGGKFNLNGDFSLASSSIAGNSTFNNAGTVVKTAGSNGTGGGFGGTVTFNNTGTVTAGSGRLNFAGTYTQSGASSLTGLALGNIAGNLALNGGLLNGSGTITGNVTNAATVKPGNSPGAITITGNYTQTAAGTLNIELDGTGAGLFSVLNIGGMATLGGTLNVTLSGGFLPVVGNAFKIMTFTDGSGTSNFATETGLSQGSVFLQPTINAADLTLNAITSTVTLAPNSLNFSNVLVNTTSATMSATLTNNTGASITISSITPSGANAGEFPLQTGSGICAQNAVLAAGSSCNLTYVFKPTALGPQGPIAVTIADSRPGNSVLTLNGTGIAPDVTISKSHTGDFTVGSNGAYTIKVTNNGTSPTTGNITVTDTLPTGLSFASNAGANWACSAAAQVVTCTYSGPALAATGGSSTLTLNVSVGPNAISSPSASGFTVSNTATVSDPNDTVTTGKSATDPTTNIDNVQPTQSTFSPILGLIAGATTDQQIMLTGTGFNASTQVNGFGTTLTGTASTDGKTLTITVPHADLATAGTVTITVINPKNPTTNIGGGTASANQSFPLVGLQSLAPQTGTPNPVPIVAGTPFALQMNLNLTPAGASLPADVNITCSFPMALTGATCTPSPATIPHGTTSASSIITIKAIPTTGAAAALKSSPWIGGPGPWSTSLLWLVATVLLSMLGMWGTIRQRTLLLRRAPVYLTLALLVLSAGALVGCTTAHPTPTPTGPSSITVTATAADGATVTTTVNITVSN